MRIPGYLLRQAVQVAPFAGVWGSYGLASTVACQVREQLTGSPPQPGVVRQTRVTVVAQLDTVCPVGSRVTLPDGRTGYASAVAHHTSGGLATPDHVEIEITLGAASPAGLGAVTVTVMRRVENGADRYGNVLFRLVSTSVPGCSIRPLSSNERTGSRDQVVDTVEVVMPAGTQIAALDRFAALGLVYEVDGTPDTMPDSVTGASAGVKVIGKRYAG